MSLYGVDVSSTDSIAPAELPAAMDVDTACNDQHDQPEHSKTFQPFSRLPAELRLKIWDMNMPESRVVSVRCGPNSPLLPDTSLYSGSWSTGCRSDAAVPVNLHVCTESRYQTLRFYSLSLGWARGPGQVFFRPEKDILYFGPREGYMLAESQFHSCMTLCDQDQLAEVRRIAISDALFWIDDRYVSMTAASITVGVIQQLALRMYGLEELIFVPRTEDLIIDPDAVHERMGKQIEAAMNSVTKQFKYWAPPPWKILPMGSF